MPCKNAGKNKTTKKNSAEGAKEAPKRAEMTKVAQKRTSRAASVAKPPKNLRNVENLPTDEGTKWRRQGRGSDAGIEEGHMGTARSKVSKVGEFHPPPSKKRKVVPQAEPDEYISDKENDNMHDYEEQVESQDHSEESTGDSPVQVEQNKILEGTPVSKRLQSLLKTPPRRAISQKKSARTTPTGRRRWTADMEARLIEMWADEKHMYDTTAKGYRNTRFRQDSLERFAADLDITVLEVETRMQSMRTVYTKAVNPPSGSSADDLTQRQLELMDTMAFLRDHVQKRETISSISKKKGTKRKAPRTIYTSGAASMVADGKSPVRITLGNANQTRAPTAGPSWAAGDGSMLTEGNDDVEDGLNEDPLMDGDIDDIEDDNPPSAKKTRTSSRRSSRDEGENSIPLNSQRFKNRRGKAQVQANKNASFLESISKSLDSMATYVASENISVEDPDFGWAKLLVDKVKQMSKAVKDAFKLHVDSLAIKAINDEWP